jgi:hypothetical protein
LVAAVSKYSVAVAGTELKQDWVPR